MRERILDIPERAEERWAQYLGEFEEDIYPHFRRLGISLSQSLIIFTLNELKNELSDLNENLAEEADDGD